jgi:hypothetical protein
MAHLSLSVTLDRFPHDNHYTSESGASIGGGYLLTPVVVLAILEGNGRRLPGTGAQ